MGEIMIAYFSSVISVNVECGDFHCFLYINHLEESHKLSAMYLAILAAFLVSYTLGLTL